MFQEPDNYDAQSDGGAADTAASVQSTPPPAGPSAAVGAVKSFADGAVTNEIAKRLESQARRRFGQPEQTPAGAGLPPGKLDRLKAGAEARKSGASLKDAYGARKGLASGVRAGAAAGDAGAKLAGDATKAAATAAKGAAVGTAKVAGKAVPVAGLLTDVDYHGLARTAKGTAQELKNLRVGRAAARAVTGVGKSAAVTLFKLSYDPWVVGFTFGLSLLVTFALGHVLLVTGGLSFMEKLGILAIDVFFAMLFIGAFVILYYTFCAGASSGTWLATIAGFFNSFLGLVASVGAAFGSGSNGLCKGF